MTGDGVPSHSNVWSADEDHARFIFIPRLMQSALNQVMNFNRAEVDVVSRTFSSSSTHSLGLQNTLEPAAVTR